MKKTLIIGSVATVLALGLVGGTLAWSQGAMAQGGWHGRCDDMGGPGRGGPGMADMGEMGGPGMGGPGMRGWAMLERFDRSGDGKVSQEDVDAVRGERFVAFDANGDGVLALEEYEALWLDAMRTRVVRGFQRLDVDGDAGVTQAEFLAPYGRVVQRLDVDGDGAVTESELSERRAEMRRRYGDDRRGDRGDGRRQGCPAP